MSYNKKEDALFLKACVIPNGVEDAHGDVLDAEDIKRIFSSFNNQKDNFDIYHNEEPVDGVSLLENYISQTDEDIGEKTAPKGSWNAVIRVDNPDIKESVFNNEFGGVSLASTIKKSCNLSLPPITTYRSIADKECITPKFLSLVDEGANGYPLVVQDYETYILKSKNYGGKTLKFEEFLKSLKQLLSQVEESEETPEEAPENEEEEKPEIKKDSDGESEAPEDGEEDKPEEEEKPDEDARLKALEDKVEALEKIVEELKPKEEDNEEESEEEAKPKIQKSRKQMNTEEPEPVPQKTFFEMTGRDEFGRKIRK